MAEQVRSAAAERLSKLGRMLRSQLVRFVIWPLLLLAVVVAGLWLFLESPRSVLFVRDHVLPRVNELLPGTIQIGAWDGTLADRIVLEDVEILDERGRMAIRAERVEVDWDAWALLSGRVEVDRLRVVRPEVLVEVRAEGGVNLAAAFVPPREEPKPPREAGDGPKLQIAVRDIGLFGGQVRVETPSAAPVELRGIDLLGSWSMQGLAEDLALRELSAELVSPLALPPVTLVGGVQLDRLDLSTDDLVITWS